MSQNVKSCLFNFLICSWLHANVDIGLGDTVLSDKIRSLKLDHFQQKYLYYSRISHQFAQSRLSEYWQSLIIHHKVISLQKLVKTNRPVPIKSQFH